MIFPQKTKTTINQDPQANQNYEYQMLIEMIEKTAYS
jgi:hypothetical protein